MPSSTPRSRLTRRTATVTIWAPLARIAATISALLRYLPVPTIRREAKVLPPMTKSPSTTVVPNTYPPPTK